MREKLVAQAHALIDILGSKDICLIYQSLGLGFPDASDLRNLKEAKAYYEGRFYHSTEPLEPDFSLLRARIKKLYKEECLNTWTLFDSIDLWRITPETVHVDEETQKLSMEEYDRIQQMIPQAISKANSFFELFNLHVRTQGYHNFGLPNRDRLARKLLTSVIYDSQAKLLYANRGVIREGDVLEKWAHVSNNTKDLLFILEELLKIDPEDSLRITLLRQRIKQLS